MELKFDIDVYVPVLGADDKLYIFIREDYPSLQLDDFDKNDTLATFYEVRDGEVDFTVPHSFPINSMRPKFVELR